MELIYFLLLLTSFEFVASRAWFCNWKVLGSILTFRHPERGFSETFLEIFLRQYRDGIFKQSPGLFLSTSLFLTQ